MGSRVESNTQLSECNSISSSSQKLGDHVCVQTAVKTDDSKKQPPTGWELKVQRVLIGRLQSQQCRSVSTTWRSSSLCVSLCGTVILSHCQCYYQLFQLCILTLKQFVTDSNNMRKKEKRSESGGSGVESELQLRVALRHLSCWFLFDLFRAEVVM